MVCDRCKMVVRNEIERHGWTPVAIDLGEVIIEETLTDTEKAQFDNSLKNLGFELIDDKKTRTVERIKNLVLSLVRRNYEGLKTNLSDYLASELAQDYSALSNLFSQQTGFTIEQYHILQKIERAKELLEYNELSLAQIASDLHYSSASHLTRQFKKVTGMTPTGFRASRVSRIPINRL